MTQSFAFQEAVSDLGQGVLSGANMMPPWKQSSAAYLLQNDGLVLGPNPSDKGHKRRRSFTMPTKDHSQLRQGMLFTDHLPHEGSSNDFLQRPLDPNLPGAGGNNFFDLDAQSFQIGRRGYYSGMLESAAYAPVRAPHLDHFNGDFMGRMADTNATNQCMNDAFNATHASAQTHMNRHPVRSVESAMANFQALIDQGQSSSGFQAYNGHSNHSNAQGSTSFLPPNYSHANVLTPTINTPNLLHSNHGGFAVPTFGSTGNNPFSNMSNVRNGFEQFDYSSVTLPFEEIAHTSDHMRPGPHVPDTNWPKLSCRTTESSANQSFYDPISMGVADNTPLTPQSPCTPRGNQGINMVISDEMQEALQETERLNSMDMPETPHHNSRGRKLGYVAPQEWSSARGIFHGFEGLDSQPGDHLHVYFDSNIDKHVVATVVESAVSETTGTRPEDAHQELFSQTHDPPGIPVEVDAGEKDSSSLKFDLNEVPGFGEPTPKPRKKYHPRVAKDKRTYKRRMNGKKIPADPVDGTNTESPAKKVTRRNHMQYDSTNEEGRDSSFPEAMDMDIEDTTQRSFPVFETYTGSTRFTSGDQFHQSLNVEHDTAVCDCEACIKVRLERRGSATRGADIFNNAPSPVSPPEKSHNHSHSHDHSHSWGGHAFRAQESPDSTSKSPSVRRNLFSPQGHGPSSRSLQACFESNANSQDESVYTNTNTRALTSTPTSSSCLQQLNQSAAQLGIIRQDHYNTTSEISRLQDMVEQHRDNVMAMNRRNLLYQQIHSSYGGYGHAHAHSYGAQSGAIVPATNPAFEWTPSRNPHFQQAPARANNASIMSRLCPRGILSPQNVPFRMMNKIQRVVYLKSILRSSHQLQIAPETLLHHVHEHLPEHEKAEFKSLWGIILTPVTDQQMQQLVEHAQTQAHAHAQTECTALVPLQICDRKVPRAKRCSKKEAEMSKAMTLWPDLIDLNTSLGKPGKEKGRKGVKMDRQERQNSNGSVVSAEGMEMVPYENKSVVPYEGPFMPLRKRKPRPKVVLDNETVRVWKLLMGKNGTEHETDAEKEMKWEEERRKMKAQAQIFIERMHIVQGDRSFSCWKGSVVDSVVGAFLTQNVNDVLSSSAFMSMRSRFPGRGFRRNHQTPPHVLESQESRNAESYLTTTSPPSELQTPQSHSEQSQTASKTSENSPSGHDQSSQVVATTEEASTHLEVVTSLGSELVDGNQPSHGKYNPKTGLTGLERARIEEKQVSARKSFDFSGLQEEFKPRVEGQERLKGSARTEATEDGVDWEAVRRANVQEVADVIKERGLNWILAGRIKAFLERIHLDYGALDLEWLRSMSTDQTKEFLLSIRGLGLKSVECIRLLTLHHLAFPVDTNVGRICVRLGWVPLEPLPEELQLHLLELYPVQATIQKYLWPRLCKLDQQTLYELHYQMITFGKVFCTKSKPNCNACPMRPECKHFASALSSAKLALPASETSKNGPPLALPPASGSSPPAPPRPVSQYCMPIVEEPMTPESEADVDDLDDIEDFPFSVEEVEDVAELNMMCIQDPGHSCTQTTSHVTHVAHDTPSEPGAEPDSEPGAGLGSRDGFGIVQEIIMEDWGGLATGINVSEQGSCPDSGVKVVESWVDQESDTIELTAAVVVNASGAGSQEMVLVAPGAASIPVPKLKNVGRLRTVHYVYELPDNHPLLDGLDPREGDDPCTYLLAIWSPGEVPESIPNINDTVNEDNPFASSSSDGEESIKATLLVPCRTAMQGSFPLNGTYFQTNEVFADHASSLQPILVARTLLWNLRRRFVFFGTSVTSIFRGMTAEEIQACFWRGYVCVRGFDRSTRAPKPLVGRLHLQAGKTSGKGTNMDP